MLYFAFTLAVVSDLICVLSPFLISMCAFDRSPSAAIDSLSGSHARVTLSATMSASAIASSRTVLCVVIWTGNVRFGILCSFSSMSRSGRLNVLVVLPFILMFSLLSATSSVSMSLALARLST